MINYQDNSSTYTQDTYSTARSQQPDLQLLVDQAFNERFYQLDLGE